MIYAGANLKSTKDGMILNDGGCCIIKDNKIIAIGEERVSQKKHDSGYAQALEYCCNAFKIKRADIDKFVISSCCEKAQNRAKVDGIDDSKVYVCPSHHLSHALSVFMTSPFKQSLIMVIDNEGNILETDNQDDQPFHKRHMEHMTYYIGDEDGIRVLEQDEVDPDFIGIADAYRYFTHYLGFPSYCYAGKTMGLAAYGNKERFKGIHLFELVDGKVKCNIRNDYFKCEEALEEYLKAVLKDDFIPRRYPIEPITQDHADLAGLIQRELERILALKVNYLVQKTNIRNLCIAGGIGLNTVANSYIKENCNIDNLYVIPAAGDTGQCLGNAIYGYCQDNGFKTHLDINYAYLGKEYSANEIEQEVIPLYENETLILKKYTDDLWAERIASLIAADKYVAVFNGRSEFGPRALGNRSILANPINCNTKDYLNRTIKYREAFRPFAPIVKYEKIEDYFDYNEESPYMLLVAKVKKAEIIPAVTHIDGTARIQTMKKEQNERIYTILEHFEKITGVPIVLNTSFNIAGKPIVENPKDAIECFLNSNLDCLAIGNYIIEKKEDYYIPISKYNEFIVSLGSDLSKV